MAEYLAIDGWEEFQKYRGRRAGFILDATDQFERGKITGLSIFVRGVLQELRRLRGRSGENILYDITHIARSIHAMPTDRPHLQHAIDTLIARGVLILTNQVHDFAKPGEIEKENKNEKEKKPSAKAKPRGTLPEQSKVSKATGESRHHRVEQLVKGFYADWAGVECPWDGSEAGQLGRMLKAWPNQPDQQFVVCLEHLARSDCIPKGDRPREWLGKLPKFVQGPLDQWWKPKGAVNGNVSKAQQRERERDRKWNAIAGGSTPDALPEGGGIRLRPGLERGENRAMAGPAQDETAILPPGDH